MSRPVRVLLIAVLVVAVVVVLFTVVFPWVDRVFVTDPVVGGTPDGATRSAAAAATTIGA